VPIVKISYFIYGKAPIVENKSPNLIEITKNKNINLRPNPTEITNKSNPNLTYRTYHDKDLKYK